MTDEKLPSGSDISKRERAEALYNAFRDLVGDFEGRERDRWRADACALFAVLLGAVERGDAASEHIVTGLRDHLRETVWSEQERIARLTDAIQQAIAGAGLVAPRWQTDESAIEDIVRALVHLDPAVDLIGVPQETGSAALQEIEQAVRDELLALGAHSDAERGGVPGAAARLIVRFELLGRALPADEKLSRHMKRATKAVVRAMDRQRSE